MRTLVVLLLLIVCFLGGALFGINKNELSMFTKADGEVGVIEHTAVQERQDETNSNKANEDAPSVEQQDHIQATVPGIDGPENTTQKTASMLETVIKGFYDLVVEILYQFSEVFF